MTEVIERKFIEESFETDEQKEKFHSYLRSLISNQQVKVTFVKKDGSLRELRGTTNFEHIPKEHHPEEGKERKANPVLSCTIFDLDANGWRMFNFDTITKVELANFK